MIATGTTHSDGKRTAFEFDAFEALPCGCVATRFRVLPWHGHVVRIEARGAYCPFDQHEPRAIIGIGIRSDAMSTDDPAVALV
jgi:hypothetical protein